MIQYKTSALGTNGTPVPDASGTGMIEVAAPSGALAVATGRGSYTLNPKTNMKPQALEEQLRETMSRASRGMSEKDALEAALSVADEWKMRLDELEAEKGDED